MPDDRGGASPWMYVAAGMTVVAIAVLAAKFLTRTQLDWKDGSPAWSPDGRRIAFMSWRNGKTELFTMNGEGSDQKKLVSMDRGDAVDPRWSPDGSRIAFVHLPDGMNGRAAIICTVNADGTALHRLR